MSNLIKHAETELKLAGLFDKDSDYNGMLGDATMELIKVFSEQGNSSFSASMVSNLFNELSRYKPLTPLTFKDDEWCEVIDDKFQNKRRSSVFKEGKNGRPYFIDAFVMVAVFPDGHRSSWSGTLELENNKTVRRCYIKDPAKMPTVRIELKAHYNNNDHGDWDFELAKEKQLKELRKYYDFEIITQPDLVQD